MATMAIDVNAITTKTGKAATATERSRNSKLGDGKCSATSASQHSCDAACPFRDNGCYAEDGPQGWTTRRLNKSEVTDPIAIAQEEADAIEKLTGKRPLRLHVVGDSPNDEAAAIVANAVKAYKLKHNQKAWTYTHAWRTVNRASWGVVSVLASCEKPEQVLEARAKGFATAMVVEQFASEKLYVQDGIKLLPCPQQTGKAPDCAQCKLCFDDTRLFQSGLTIAFEAHGNKVDTVKAQLIQIG